MEALQKSIQNESSSSDEEDGQNATSGPSASLKEGKAKADPELADFSLNNLNIDEEKVEPSTKMQKMVRASLGLECIQLTFVPSCNTSRTG